VRQQPLDHAPVAHVRGDALLLAGKPGRDCSNNEAFTVRAPTRAGPTLARRWCPGHRSTPAPTPPRGLRTCVSNLGVAGEEQQVRELVDVGDAALEGKRDRAVL
jgi:hypothetical protein